MSYLQDKKQKGFAHILSVLLLVGGLAASVYLVQQRQIFTPKAAGEAVLTARCLGITGYPGLSASWNLPSGSGYNIYIRAGTNDYQIDTTQIGTWEGSLLPGGPSIVEGGSYYLFASNGTNTYSDGPKQVNCATPTPAPAPGVGFYQTCPGNVPTLNAWWHLAPGAAYNIYIRAGTQDYQIGTTQEGNWRGTQLPNGPNIVTGGSYTLFASNGSNTLSQSEQIVACSALPTPLPLMPAAELRGSCPNGHPTLSAWWSLSGDGPYSISIIDSNYPNNEHNIGNTAHGRWSGDRLPDGSRIIAGRRYKLFATDSLVSYDTSWATISCGVVPIVTPCTVSWRLSNTQPPINTNIIATIRGLSDPSNPQWQNIRLYKDNQPCSNTSSGCSLNITSGPTFTFSTVKFSTLGTHTLSFKTDNGTKTCTPTVSFTTVSPKQNQKWWQ